MAETRIYKAKRARLENADEVRFIRAGNQAQVGRHIASDWVIAPATANDVALNRAIPVETAGE